MVVRGCQRCFLKQLVIQGDQMHQKRYGWFRILPEHGMPSPLRLMMPTEWKTAISCLRPNDLDVVFLTPFPPALFATVDTRILMQSIMEEIKTWQLTGDSPTDATDFSYWVASNLPLPAQSRLQLLGAVSTTHRLRACLMMLRAFTHLLCTGDNCNGRFLNHSDQAKILRFLPPHFCGA